MIRRFLLPILASLLSACLPSMAEINQGKDNNLLETAWDDRSIYSAGLISTAKPTLEKLEGATHYHLDLRIGDDPSHAAGNAEIFYTNTEDEPLDTIQLRLFPNILGGEMVVENVMLDGVKPKLTYRLNDSLLILAMDTLLLPGERRTIDITYSLTVPENVDSNYGVLAYFNNVLTLAHAYPMIAVFDDEGWNAEIPPAYGDVTYADASFFLVRVEAPEQLLIAASGSLIDRVTENGKQIVTFAAGPARDFYLATSPGYMVKTRQLGEVALNFYSFDENQAGAEEALDIAERVLLDYNTRYGQYPYAELDFVATPTQALGVEYPGIIAIADWILEPGNGYLEYVLAHEIGHQWFYNLVGNDQLDDPWLDESLTQFATLQYFTDAYGEPGMQRVKDELLGRWESIGRANIPAGLPVAEYSQREYSAIVYGRGAVFFVVLRDYLGSEIFDASLRDYTEEFAWQIATPEKLEATVEEHCSCDIYPIFNEWIYGTAE